MSKDIEDTLREAEETIASLDKMANERMNDAETKIKKGIVQSAIYVLATVAIYFIWGTTWFFWVSFVLSFILLGGIIFAKVMIAKAHKKMTQKDSQDYDFEEFTQNIETKLFAKQTYVSVDGLDFDEKKMILNGREITINGMIFEDLTKAQLEKAIPLLDNLEKLDAKARKKWLELFEEEDEEVCEYIDMHFNNFGDDVKKQVLDELKIKEQENRAFLENLKLGSFHITEGDEEESVEIVMDYALIWEDGISFTDQVLAMHFTDKFKYDIHTHDS